MNRWKKTLAAALHPFGNRRVAACLLLVLLAALAPAALFLLADAARLGRVETVENAYASQTPGREDYYLARVLAERREARSAWNLGDDADDSLYVSGSSSRTGMTAGSNYGTRALELVGELVQCGALPQAWLDSLTDETGAKLYNYYSSTDSMGFMTITYYDTTWKADGSWTDLPLMSMLVDTHTQSVVGLFLSSPEELEAPDPAAALNAWLTLLGLDGLGDWVPPADTYYQASSLYSANGGLLASCVSHPYLSTLWEWANAKQRWYLAFVLSPYDDFMLDAARLPGITPVSATMESAAPDFAVGELSPLSNWNYSAHAYYSIYRPQSYVSSSGLITRVDFADARQQLLCQKPSCTHDSADCPAYTEDCYSSSVFEIDGAVYLCYTVQKDDPSVPSESCIDVITGGGTQRTRLATLPVGTLEWIACDGQALYATRYDYSGFLSYCTCYRVDLKTGAYQTFTLLNEQVCGVLGSDLVTMRYVCDFDRWNAICDGLDVLYDASWQGYTIEYCRYDMTTGRRELLADFPGDSLYSSNSAICLPNNVLLYHSVSEAGSSSLEKIQFLRIGADGSQDDFLESLPYQSSLCALSAVCDSRSPGAAVCPYFEQYDYDHQRYFLINGDTGDQYLLTQWMSGVSFPSLAAPVAVTPDGRFLVQLSVTSSSSNLYRYGLIPVDDYLANRNNYQMVEADRLPMG